MLRISLPNRNSCQADSEFIRKASALNTEADPKLYRIKAHQLLQEHGSEIKVGKQANAKIKQIFHKTKDLDYAITLFRRCGCRRPMPKVEIVKKELFAPFVRCSPPLTRTAPLSKEDADHFVQILASSDIPMQTQKVDHARAALIYQILRACKVEPVEKIVVQGNLHPEVCCLQSQDVQLDSYMAVIITDKMGKQYIIDPSLDPTQALTKEQWRAKVTESPQVDIRKEEIIDGGYTKQKNLRGNILVTDKIFTRYKRELFVSELTSLVPSYSKLQDELQNRDLPRDGLSIMQYPDRSCCQIS